MDQQSQFQFDLEQNLCIIICSVKTLVPDCHKRTIQYLIKKFVLDTTAWTTLHLENEEDFQQMIAYLYEKLKARGCRSRKRRKQ